MAATTISSHYSLGVSPPVFSTDGTNIIMQMGVPDNLLGPLIGKGGAVIKDIMAVTGTFAQVRHTYTIILETSMTMFFNRLRKKVILFLAHL